MAKSKPLLHIFAISHFCEKARWALDYLDIDYAIRHLPPGRHVAVARGLGCDKSGLPILTADGEIVQGSAQIVTWADRHVAPSGKRLHPEIGFKLAMALEHRFDVKLGVHIRRLFYSEAVVDYPEKVRPIFSNDLGLVDKAMFAGSWGMVRKRMIALMDLGPEQREESRYIVASELDWFDELLSNGRRFLVGERFSRADVTAASILAPLAMPREHPTYAGLQLTPLFEADLKTWADRPSLTWVRGIYSEFR
jgi:glutathione S-transferase